MIRDHGLHLYVFVLPDLFNRESILAFDETNPVEHELVHDCFAVKEAGNKLSIATGGRSVHAPLVTIGGFTQIPSKEVLSTLRPILSDIRPKVLRLIDIFLQSPFEQKEDLKFLALDDPEYSFLTGNCKTNDGTIIPKEEFEKNLTCQLIPYSQATGCLFHGRIHMVGALARMNVNADALHPRTKQDTQKALSVFPSQNIFHNNLAQAIEMLHAIDSSIDLISNYQAVKELPPKVIPRESVGIGLIEAPRGILFHRVRISGDGTAGENKVIVPTAQNQIGIEDAIKHYVQRHIDLPKDTLMLEIQKLIRAYDPCMSCATHFLKIRWK